MYVAKTLDKAADAESWAAKEDVVVMLEYSGGDSHGDSVRRAGEETLTNKSGGG